MTAPHIAPDTAPPTDTRHAMRVGLLALAIGFGGFALWATLAPLDEGVPSQGMVVVDTKRKPVQHPAGGIIKQVLVHEGDVVKDGQPLIELDEAVAKANLASIRMRYFDLRAQAARLHAEQTGALTISFADDLRAASGDTAVQALMQTQQQLFAARRASLKADVDAIEESIRGQELARRTYVDMQASRQKQQALIREELQQLRPLVAEGYAPLNKQRELERNEADTQAALTELAGNIARTASSISELRQHRISKEQEFRKDVETQLVEVNREMQIHAEKLVAVQADLNRTEIRSPAAGQVVGLAMQSVGGVIQPGQKIMDIVPVGEPLMLEVRIDPHLIDKVHAGLETDVRFATFAHAPQLVVPGIVQSISSDLLEDQVGGNKVMYYLARVRVTPDGMKALGAHRMQPGMPVEVVIKTGERSMLSYLLGPLHKRLASVMKEE
mgnify:CR=1 FL=1